MLERLPRPLEPDRLEILQGRHARMLDEEPQQVPLRGVPGLRERRHVPVALGLIEDGVLHPMHRRMEMPSMRCWKGDCSGSRSERLRYTTMSSATLAASASPHSSAMRCSATSIPAVMPALEAIGPSTTKTRLSITFACGASARSVCSSSWCVVQRRPPSSPARAASSVPEQIVTRRCSPEWLAQRIAEAPVQPARRSR